MSSYNDKSLALLPQGFVDVLPPQADQEAQAISQIMRVFQSYGYQRVKPPLLEFEDSLFAPGPGESMKDESFRVMDPVSHKMLGLRSDITPQIARIGQTRLAELPHPLRLCYANDVLRTKNSQQRTARQFCQVGFELIGADTPQADIEVCVVALRALQDLGVQGVVLNLSDVSILQNVLHNSDVGESGCFPAIDAEGAAEVTDVADVADVVEVTEASFMRALEQRQRDGLKDLPGDLRDFLLVLMDVGQPAEKMLETLKDYAPPYGFEASLERLSIIYQQVLQACEALKMDVRLGFDLLERKGFEYKTGVAFTVYAKGVHGELGRGGRYDFHFGDYEQKQSASGCTLYMDTLRKAMPEAEPQKSVFVSHEMSWDVVQDLQDGGWIVVRGTGIKEDGSETTHIYKDGKVEERVA